MKLSEVRPFDILRHITTGTLYLVRVIAGKNLHVEDVQGRPATFTFTFQFEKADAEAAVRFDEELGRVRAVVKAEKRKRPRKKKAVAAKGE
ncbi:MAG: hypothetical protein AAB320_06810 [Elusimicrobiota bacterium]|mgnify:CR=1 FL=1